MQLKRKENELYIQYLTRITNLLKNKQIDHKQWGDLALGDKNVYSIDNCRKSSYVVNLMLPELEKDILNINGDVSDSILEQIENAKDELYKERVKYQDVMREKRNLLRPDARYENLVEVMKETMEFLPDFQIKDIEIERYGEVEAHLMLSDIHHGLSIDNVVDVYSKDICKERFDVLANRVIKCIEQHNISLLHISIAGDLINGAISISHRVEQEEDLITQIIEVSEILSHFIAKIKEHTNVKLYGVVGNHSRVTADKRAGIKSENFERLIFKFIEQRIGQTISQNGYEDFMTFKIKDKLIGISHGDKDTISNAKMHFVNVTNQIPDEIWLGHIHHFNVKDDNGTQIIVNGSFALDDYALSLRCNTHNYQILKVYGDSECIYQLNLDN